MHEMGIVLQLAKTLDETAEEQGLTHLFPQFPQIIDIQEIGKQGRRVFLNLSIFCFCGFYKK